MRKRYWERVYHNQKLAQHKEEQKIQLDLMKVLMETKPQVPPRRQLPPKFVFRKSLQADDISHYLKRQITSADLEQQHWVFKLSLYLTGKAQQAYGCSLEQRWCIWLYQAQRGNPPQVKYHCGELLPTVQSNFQETWRILPTEGWDIWQRNG